MEPDYFHCFFDIQCYITVSSEAFPQYRSYTEQWKVSNAVTPAIMKSTSIFFFYMKNGKINKIYNGHVSRSASRGNTHHLSEIRRPRGLIKLVRRAGEASDSSDLLLFPDINPPHWWQWTL